MTLDEPPPLSNLPVGVQVALRRLDTEAGVRVLGWVIAAVLVLALAVLVGRGGSKPADPSFEGASAPTLGRSGIPGYSGVRLMVTDANGTHELCVALAATDTLRHRGMTGRTSFGGYDGMVFVFPADTNASFFMRDTPLPLSIAWFDARGAFVSATDMAPCPDRDGCPTFEAARPYRTAVEVPEGQLGPLGIGPGTTTALGSACGPV